jgi:hypothetical protein
VFEGKPDGELSPKKEKEYSKVNTIFCAVVIRVLAETLQDTYPYYKTEKEMYDTLNTEYEGSNADTELYIIEQYHDYQMAKVENQLEKKIKRFSSDSGGEYFSNEFDLFCVEHGIINKRITH